MPRDPRKILVRLSDPVPPRAFDQQAAEALLAELSAQAPLSSITVIHRQAFRQEPRARRRIPSPRVVGWAAIAAGVVVGVLTGVATLQNWRTPATPTPTFEIATPAPSAFMIQPKPAEPAPTRVASEIAPMSEPKRPTRRDPQTRREAQAVYASGAPAPVRSPPPPEVIIDRSPPPPVELAMIAPPSPPQLAPRPRALVVVRQSGEAVLGAPQRSQGVRVEGASVEDLRSLDAERMAAAVDARQAARAP